MVKHFIGAVIALFFLSGFLFIPLTFLGSGEQEALTRLIFLKPVAVIQKHCFAGALNNIDFSSDTIGLNILLALLLLIAIAGILALRPFKIKTDRILTVFQVISPYYIALVLLKYGFDKLFKQQFYLPEPNILYSNFGALAKDTLFWSTMGLSHGYSVATGVIEILTAILILARRTRVLGFCIGLGVMINILIINFSFDISVKTFSTFLLAVIICYLWPYFKTFYEFFVQRRQAQLPDVSLGKPRLSKTANLILSTVIICFVLIPYLKKGVFNDDQAPRPLLHGAYQITGFISGGDTLKIHDFPYKRFFIHRNSYLIFQEQNDRMTDYFFELDSTKKQLVLRDYQDHQLKVDYQYQSKTRALQLIFSNNKRWVINAIPLNWKALPAVQDEWHYTIDEIK